MKKPTESGFTLVEVLISSVILIPILFAILSTRDVVGTTIAANQRRADAGDQVRRVARRVRQMARPGLASTVRVRATKADVDAATAAEAQRL
ncbi:MAG: prepilin-type N-terminal cleavage/methylation domain-containing protein, partial [Planctomycetota bacterium]